jgi:hypothetical protein
MLDCGVVFLALYLSYPLMSSLRSLISDLDISNKPCTTSESQDARISVLTTFINRWWSSELLLERGRDLRLWYIQTSLSSGLRLRRWYSVISFHETPEEYLNDVLENPYWVNIVRRTGHRGRDDSRGSWRWTSVAPLHDFVVPLKSLFPPPISTAVVPSVSISELQDRRFLSGPINRCTWMGINVVFKQILRGGVRATRIWREITLLNQLRGSSCFLPILAYVVDDEVRTRGFLLPHAGLSLDEASIRAMVLF